MSRFHAVRAPFTAVWLSVQLLATAGTVIAVTSGHSDLVCTCAHGADHGTCPMHRKPADPNRCRLQGTERELASVLMPMLGSLALPPVSTAAVVPPPSPDPTAYSTPLPSDWIVPPDPRPPRR